MTEQESTRSTDIESGDPQPSGVSKVRRRTIVKGAAWSIPVIAAAVAVPAYAASGAASAVITILGTDPIPAGGTRAVQIVVRNANGDPVPNQAVSMTLPDGIATWTSSGLTTISGTTDATGTFTASMLVSPSAAPGGPHEVTGMADAVVATPDTFNVTVSTGTVFRSNNGSPAVPVGTRTDILKVYPGNGNPFALSAAGVLYRLVDNDWAEVSGMPDGVTVLEAMATPAGTGDINLPNGAWARLSDGSFAYVPRGSTSVARVVTPPTTPAGPWWGTGLTAGINPALTYVGTDGMFHINKADGTWGILKGVRGSSIDSAIGISGETAGWWLVGWTSDGSIYNWGEYADLRARYVRTVPNTVEAIYGSDVITARDSAGKLWVTRWDNTTGTKGVTELKQKGGEALPGPVTQLSGVRGSSEDSIVFVIDGQVWGAQTDETSNYSNAIAAPVLPNGASATRIVASGDGDTRGTGNVYVLGSDNVWYRSLRDASITPPFSPWSAWTQVAGLPAGAIIDINVGQSSGLTTGNGDGWAVVSA